MSFRSYDLLRMLDDFGRDLTLIYVSEGSYDPSTASLTGGSTSNATVRGYFYNYRLDEVDGSSIVLGDRRLLLPATDTSGNTLTEPDIGDEVTGSGDKVSIVAVTKIFSGTGLVCYLCQVRE